MDFLTDKITKPFQFTVEWEDGYVWVMGENGSGIKYACDTASSVAYIVECYITDMQTSALFDKARAENIKDIDDIVNEDEKDLWNSIVEEYEMMEGNRDVY